MPVESSNFTMAYCLPRVFAECVDIKQYLKTCCFTQTDTLDNKVVVTGFSVEADSVKPHSAFGYDCPTSACPDYAYLLDIRDRIKAAVKRVKSQSSSRSVGRKKNKKSLETWEDFDDLVKSCVQQTHDMAAGIKRTDTQPFNIPDDLQIDLTKITSPWDSWEVRFSLGYPRSDTLGQIGLDEEAVISQIEDHLIESIRSPCMPGVTTEPIVAANTGSSACLSAFDGTQSGWESDKPLLGDTR